MKKECIVFATTFLLAVLTAFSVLGFDFSTLGIPVIPGNAPNGQAVTGVNSSGNLQYRNVAANLASPGPIGNASASTGNFTTLQSTVLMVNGGANFIGNAPQMFTVNGNAQINGAVNGFSFTANGNAVVTAANIIATSFTVTPSNVTITGAANSSYNLASFGGITNSTVAPRMANIGNVSTLTINVSNIDLYSVTNQAASLTVANVIGTPFSGQSLIVCVTDNGSAHSITWGTIFTLGSLTLPNSTPGNANNAFCSGFIYLPSSNLLTWSWVFMGNN